ncbi:radical SAM protein [Magnetospirillum aberrantis]|uniref:Radical SAM protein n=1 Tax=Magnetospirillum aberrantis SpK TaxID=908842 RepID=A0A7C9V0H9_9PROT|nr:radical SAM protein [Magnetospirillum aberrantis]NFV81174.1 radical SAM protein [Magnetospirillum aberrantis SpK]
MALQLNGHKLLHHVDELVKWKRGEDFFPIHLDISPIGKCNHRCAHCYVEYLGHRGPKLEREAFLRLAADIGRCGVKSAFIAGTGEPFLNEATVDAIRIGRENGTDMAVSTNGVLLDEDKLNGILPYLTWMRFSILGGSAPTYAKLQSGREADWDKLVQVLSWAGGIKARRGLDVTLGAVFCVMPENGHEVALLARRLKDSGIDYMVVKPASQNERNTFRVPLDMHERFRDQIAEAEALSGDGFHVEVRMDQFNQMLKRTYKKCLGLPFITMIGEDGGIYTCNGHWGNPDFCYGNIHEQSFEEIWNGPRRREVQRRIEAHLDFDTCEPICRQNSINQFLWGLRSPPDHINFI